MINNDDFLVVVDAGHGGVDSGAVNGNNLEKDFTLRVSKYIYDRLKELGIPAVITRTTDKDLPKNERINLINQISKKNPNVIVLSNHINAGGGEGAEVVYGLRNNDRLANMILNNIGDAGQVKRKVYQRRLPENPNKDYYYIIRETDPRQSLLIEYGFIDNNKDLNKLQNNLLNYAEGVVKAVADYINIPYFNPGQTIPEEPQEENIYIVQKGDTLWSIARKTGLTVDELKEINNLTSNTISIGQQLKLEKEPIEQNIYIVQKGDSLWAIARKLGVNVNDLINYNNLTSTTIGIGQQLKIPQTNQEYYTVQRGDTLYSIARRFNTTVDKIIQDNNLLSSMLSIGQQLVIK